MKSQSDYLTSKEKMAQLKVSACELMHMREAGKLKYFKKGNAYIYESDS